MRYLGVHDVLYLHVLEVGPDVPLRDRGLLESAVARPQQSAFGEDAYPTLHLKAAALLQSLAQNQPFEDGNKRVAVLATFVFLGLNGLEVNTDDDAIVALMIDIAVVPLTLDQIAERLETWTTPKPPRRDLIDVSSELRPDPDVSQQPAAEPARRVPPGPIGPAHIHW